MVLQKLVELVQGIGNDLGYEFYFGSQKKINSTVRDLPVLWMEMPSITDVDGINEGRVTYCVSIYLIQKAQYSLAVEQCGILHSDAIAVYNNLALSQAVGELSEFEVDVNYFLFAPLNDATAHLEFEVEMEFNSKISCDDNNN